MKKERSRNIKVQDQKEFCTECGEELNDLALSPDGDNMDAALDRYHKCKEKGKFKGDMCARVFIANEEDMDREEPES